MEARGKRIRAQIQKRDSVESAVTVRDDAVDLLFSHGKVWSFPRLLFAMWRLTARVALTPPQSPPVSPKERPSKFNRRRKSL